MTKYNLINSLIENPNTGFKRIPILNQVTNDIEIHDVSKLHKYLKDIYNTLPSESIDNYLGYLDITIWGTTRIILNTRSYEFVAITLDEVYPDEERIVNYLYVLYHKYTKDDILINSFECAIIDSTITHEAVILELIDIGKWIGIYPEIYF